MLNHAQIRHDTQRHTLTCYDMLQHATTCYNMTQHPRHPRLTIHDSIHATQIQTPVTTSGNQQLRFSNIYDIRRSSLGVLLSRARVRPYPAYDILLEHKEEEKSYEARASFLTNYQASARYPIMFCFRKVVKVVKINVRIYFRCMLSCYSSLSPPTSRVGD